MATSSSAATDATDAPDAPYPIRLQGVPPPPLTKAGKPSKSATTTPHTQQRHLVQIVPSHTTVPQLRLDAHRLFGASLAHYDVELRVGFPPRLIGVGEGGKDEDEETLVKDFVGRNESVTVRFVPSGGNQKKNQKKSKADIRTSGSGIVGVRGGAGGGGGSAAAVRAAPKRPAPKTTSSAAAAAAGKKRSRAAASAAAAADDSDEYDPTAADDADDDGSDDGGNGNGNGNNGQDAAANANGGRRSKRAASAAATAALPAIVREQDRLMAQQQRQQRQQQQRGKKTTNLGAARAAAAEKRAAAAAARKMAALPGRRLGDGSDVAPTRTGAAAAAAAAATKKRKKRSRGTTTSSTLFGTMSSEDDVSYALLGSMAGGGGGGGGGGAGGGKIGKVLRAAMKGAVGKSYEASRAAVRVDAVRAGKFQIVAKSDAASATGSVRASASASGGSGTASASHVGMYVARYSKGVEGRGEYEEDVEIIALEALRAVVAAVHADHSDDDLEAAGGGSGGGGSGREMLRPASMAQLSPRVFWSLAHHCPGTSTEDALRMLLPHLDWSFLDGRSRMLSEKARENRRQEKVARGEIADEDDEGAGRDDGGIEAIEAVEKAMEDMAEHDRSNARERAARAALARFDGESPAKASANAAAATDKTRQSGSVAPETWKLVTPTDEDEDELAECIREGFASSEGGAYEATDSDIKAWTAALMNQCSVHNWRELANVPEGSSIASLMSDATPGHDRPTTSDIDGWIEAARGRSVEEIAMEIVDGNEEAYVALRDAASAGTPKDLFAWRAMTDMLLEEIQGCEGADVSDVTEADLKRWCTRAGTALNEADWLIWYATPSA